MNLLLLYYFVSIVYELDQFNEINWIAIITTKNKKIGNWKVEKKIQIQTQFETLLSNWSNYYFTITSKKEKLCSRIIFGSFH